MKKGLIIVVACLCLIGILEGLSNAIEESRANKYKEDSRLKFLQYYYSNLSSSQWNDVAPEYTMEWDDKTKKWYIPKDANAKYWQRKK